MLSIITVRQAIRLLLTFFIAASFASCTIHAHIPQDYQMPPYAGGNKLPLRIGLYVNPGINDIHVSSTPRAGLVVHIGNAISRNAENMIKSISNDVVIINGLKSGVSEGTKNVDVIITPEITSISLHILQRSFSQVLDCIITIKWTIVDRNGKLLYVNTFIGEARYEPYRPIGGEKRARECVMNAIDDHFRKAYQSIANTNWW